MVQHSDGVPTRPRQRHLREINAYPLLVSKNICTSLQKTAWHLASKAASALSAHLTHHLRLPLPTLSCTQCV